jgi:type I restriction enzyme S subunit
VISRTSFTDSYPVIPLGELVEFLDSQRRPVTASDRTSGPYPYYGANGQQGTIDDFIFDEPLVLLAEDGGLFDQPDRGIAYRIYGKTWVNNHAHVLRPGKRLDIGFLFRVLENYDVTPFVTGTTRGKLTKAGASEIPIPVPPLSEQRRIAAVLDKAETLRSKRITVSIKIAELRCSLFDSIIGSPSLSRWPLIQLQELVNAGDSINYGVVQPGELDSTGVPLIRVGDILGGAVDIGNLKRISASVEASYQRSRLRGDEVLVSCVGSIGTVALAAPEMAGMNIARAVARIPLDAEKANRVFIAEYLRTPFVQRYFTGETRTVAQPTLNIKQLCTTPVSLPPMKIQNDFVDRIGRLQDNTARIRDSSDKLESLFSCLQHRAFNGEL